MSTDVLDVPVDGGFRIELPPALVSLSISRSAVRRVVAFRDPDAESSFLVALTEIVANAIDEHARLGIDRAVVLEMRFGSEELLRVIDVGEGFAADRRPVRSDAVVPASDPEERGRGLALARALVPEIGIETSGTGTVVTLPVTGFGIVR